MRIEFDIRKKLRNHEGYECKCKIVVKESKE